MSDVMQGGGELMPRDESASAPDTHAESMSKVLREWLDANAPTNVRHLSEQALSDETNIKPAALWRVVDDGDAASVAIRIVQGFALERLRDSDPSGFDEGLKARAWARTTANDRITVYQLFNQLGDLKAVSRAVQLSDMRIRLLLPEIEQDGILELIDTGESQGLQLNKVALMTASTIRRMRAERRMAYERKQLENAAAQGAQTPAYTPRTPDPRWIITLREEAMTLAWRIRAEIASLVHVCESIAVVRPPADKRALRVEIGAIVRSELRSAQSDAQDVIGLLERQFGDALDAPRAESRGVTQFKTQHDGVLAALEVETTQRLSGRHRRHNWRGRPAATFKAALDGALKADEKDEAV